MSGSTAFPCRGFSEAVGSHNQVRQVIENSSWDLKFHEVGSSATRRRSVSLIWSSLVAPVESVRVNALLECPWHDTKNTAETLMNKNLQSAPSRSAKAAQFLRVSEP